MKKYISIDIGGTFIKYGLINENGHILEKNQVETQASLGGEQILEKVLKIVGIYKQKEKVEGVAYLQQEW